MHSDLLKLPLLRSAIAIIAALWLLGGAAEHAWHAAATVDAAQQSGSSSSGALAVDGDHAQCDSGLSHSCLVATAVADVPRWDDAFLVYAGSRRWPLSVIALCGRDRPNEVHPEGPLHPSPVKTC